jgi:hypothetical protein
MIFLDNHPLFRPTEGRPDKSQVRGSGVLAFADREPSIPQSLNFVMAAPPGWLPDVQKFFADHKRLAASTSEELLAELEPTAGGPSGPGNVLSQAFALFRLGDSGLSAAEKAKLGNLTPPESDFVMSSLWLSQWMIASYSHENPLDLAERLDGLADAELAKDNDVSRKVVMMLVASMASYLHVVDAADVPFTPSRKPDEVAGMFFIARVDHIRKAIAKLPQDTLSDWGKSIANYQFMPPYAPLLPGPAKVESPK